MLMRAGLVLIAVCVVSATSFGTARGQGADPPYAVPRFRHASLDVKAPKLDRERLTLLADADFPPFSYGDASGNPKGIAVEEALSLCAKMSVTCVVKLLAWSDLAPALAKGDGDAAISGFTVDARTLESFYATRPLYRALGRFAVRNQNPIAEPSIRLLAGKRIAVVKGSAHEAWLQRYFPFAQIISENGLEEAEAALRDSKVDALFGDGMSLVYWTEGEASQHCCRLVPGAFVDQDYFSRGFMFFVRRGDVALKRFLDYGLDRLQEDGDWERIFRAYVPSNPW